MSRSDPDLEKAIRKACSADETSPKRKHVRTCIVYTWDHKSARQFFQVLEATVMGTGFNNGMDSDDVKVFKSLITIHKVLQEGHKSAITEGIKNMGWIQSLGKMYSGMTVGGYGRLIAEYVHYLIMKLQFHKYHKGFNGTFEYEEYVSLVTVDDPNKGYETILDLMSLQSSLFDLVRIVFATLSSRDSRGSKHNECKISCLVPLVTESYGIYKFITSMLRAMFRQTGDEEALLPLKESFETQHHQLFEFYADCSSIKFLTSLITIPKLPTDPPNAFVSDYDTEEPQLKFKSKDDLSLNGNQNNIREASLPTPTPPPLSSSTSASMLPQHTQYSQQPVMPPTPPVLQTQPTTTDLWKQQQLQYEQEQRRLEQERQQQLLLQQQQQQAFEQQQRALQEQQQQQQQQQLQQLQQQQTGAINTLQSELLTLRNQYEQDQMLLQQYDQRVQQLENEIQNINNNANVQISNKDQQLSNLHEEMNNWKSKYESLAKLYSQLRQEHLQLLTKFKKLQQRAASAQEAIERKEKLEKDLKSKNIELADLIRERDRARLDNDKLKGSKENDIDKLSLQVRELNRKLKEQDEINSTNLQKIFQQHQQELTNLKTLSASTNDGGSEYKQEVERLKAMLEDKDQELEIVQQTMDETIKELASQQKLSDSAIDEQIDQVLKEQLHKLTDIVDSILLSGMKTIQDSLFELTNPLDSGNFNTTPQYVLSLIEKASNEATNFANSFNDFLTDGPNGDYSIIISTVLQFSSALGELMVNCKGLSNNEYNATLEQDFLTKIARVAREGEYFLEDLLSDNLSEGDEKSLEEKQDIVINGNIDMQEKLNELSDIIEPLSNTHLKSTQNGTRDLATSVEHEMNNTQKIVVDAAKHLPNLLATADFSGDLAVNKAILEYAMEIIHAILKLIKSSIDCQNEIVAKGISQSEFKNKHEFYKKNSRWTEGLISASKAVADSTKLLISMADGILKNENSYEEFIVSSNDVVASTAQLVAASRVKAGLNLKSQHGLEDCSKIVNDCCKKLVKHIQSLINAKSADQAGQDFVDFGKLSIHEHKTVEMEQQVEILKLEAQLDKARKRLGEIRKFSYKDEQEEGVVQS
ncbi:hypothetical protein ACO0QE_002191 [Hanseniaspora vineae]